MLDSLRFFLGLFILPMAPLIIITMGIIGLWFTIVLPSLLDGTAEHRHTQRVRIFFGAMVAVGVVMNLFIG